MKNNKRLANTAQIDNNIILTNDVMMSLNTRQTQRNLNVMICGGSGTGKTRGYIIPNLLNANTSFCITDPKGEIYASCATFLKRMGYKIKVFNIDEMLYSSNYNPFNYVYDSDGKLDYNSVKKMINVLMRNVGGGKENSGGDPFWDMSAEKLITAIAILLLEEGAKSQQNFAAVAEKMRAIEFPTDPKDVDFKSTLDREFEALEAVNPESLGVLLYREFKQGAGKTMKSVISVANSKIQDFNLPSIKNLTHCDTLNLEKIGDEKTALFIIIPASDTTFNFLAAMMYTQMFDLLYKRAFSRPEKRLSIHVRFLLDEYANVGQIPDFDNLISTMRSVEISVSIILQAVSQLKKLYEKSWETIIASCDSFLFLGGQEDTTLKLISERLGKETIDITNRGRSRGRQSSTSLNDALHGRELLTPDEVAKMDNRDCILLVRGYPPFYSKKYNLLSHPNYMYSSLFSPEFIYDTRSVHTLLLPKQTPQGKEKQRKKLHREPVGETINPVNQEIRIEILKMKATETNMLGGLKMKTFDHATPRFEEVTVLEAGLIGIGGKLYDINAAGDKPTESEVHDDYYNIKN